MKAGMLSTSSWPISRPGRGGSGSLMSRTSRVATIAKTPSLKAPSRSTPYVRIDSPVFSIEAPSSRVDALIRYKQEMLEAALWGAAGGSSLVVGAAIGLRFKFGPRMIGLIMGFGSGVLISALTFELTEEAFRLGGADALVIGLVLLQHDELPLAIVAAVFLSNVPESLSAATGLRAAGHSPRYIISLWSGVMLV